MKSKVIAFLIAAWFCLCGLTPSHAVTIHLQDRLIGWQDAATGDQRYVLHYFFFDVPQDTQVTGALCLGADPSNTRTSLDFIFFTPPDPDPGEDQAMTVVNGFGLFRSAPCDSHTFTLKAGEYVLVGRPRNGDWDGAQGIVPVEGGGGDYNYFDYDATITGDLKLRQIWKGQRDGTFSVTIVPEPTVVGMFVIGTALVIRRNRRSLRKIAGSAALLLLGPLMTAQAEQGVLRWQSQPGMGYQLQRTMELGGLLQQQSWITVPGVRYYGTGGEMWHKCFELEIPATLPTGAGALNQIVPMRIINISARRDGSSIVAWTEGEALATAYVAPPPAGTSMSAASGTPYLDFRHLPGVAWNTSSNKIDTGTAMLAATGTPATRLWAYVWEDKSSNPPVPVLPTLSPAQIESLTSIKAQVAAIRTGLNTPSPTPETLPSIRNRFDERGNPLRDYYRMTPFLIDSDGDGYSDSGELAGSSNPHSSASLPADTDQDGFSNAEELIAGTNPNLISEHPPGGFKFPYADKGDVVITEFMADNATVLKNSIPKPDGTDSFDDWIEIYNPTGTAIRLNEDTNGDGQLTAGEDTNGNGILDRYFLSDATTPDAISKLDNWPFPPGVSIPAGGYMIVMADLLGGVGSVPFYDAANGSNPRYFHTNFVLAEGGESITLSHWRNTIDPTNANGTIYHPSEFTPSGVGMTGGRQTLFGNQKKDKSVGSFRDWQGVIRVGEMSAPTPGAANTSGTLLPLPEPDFLDENGFVVDAGVRNAPPAGGLKVHVSHPYNRDGDSQNDVMILSTDNCSNPSEFSAMHAQINALSNGYFGIPEAATGWNFAVSGTAQATLTTGDGEADVTFTAPGSAVTDVTLSSPLNLTEGTYRLHYNARRHGARSITVAITGSPTDPFTAALDNDFVTYNYTFQVPATGASAVVFQLGGAVQRVRIDSVNIVKIGALSLDKTTILRAMAVRDGWEKSPVVTQSYIFKTSVLGTAADGTDAQKKPAGWPDATSLFDVFPGTSAYQSAPNRWPDKIWYDMNPGVVAANRADITSSLDKLPSVCITLPVRDVFDKQTSGIWACSSNKGNGASGTFAADKRGLGWRRIGSMEWYDSTVRFNTIGEWEITGDASVTESSTARHNLRLNFTSNSGGPSKLELSGKVANTYEFLPQRDTTDAPTRVFNDLVLKGLGQDSWGWRADGGTSDYLRSALTARLFRAMDPGNVSPHYRWVHLYLNGLYWGVYGLTEQTNENFATAYMGLGTQSFIPEVMKDDQGLSTTPVSWLELHWRCEQISRLCRGETLNVIKPSQSNATQTLRTELIGAGIGLTVAHFDANGFYIPNAFNGLSATELATALYPRVQALLDVNSYIDYIMAHVFAIEVDWGVNNFTALRGGDGRYRFVPAGTEQSYGKWGNDTAWVDLFLRSPLQLGLAGGTNYRSAVAAMTHLIHLAEFRNAVGQRIQRHFHATDGVFAVGTPTPQTPDLERINAKTHFQLEYDVLKDALHAEAGRWGNIRATPSTYATWQTQMTSVEQRYFASRPTAGRGRRQMFLDDLESHGLLPVVSGILQRRSTDLAWWRYDGTLASQEGTAPLAFAPTGASASLVPGIIGSAMRLEAGQEISYAGQTSRTAVNGFTIRGLFNIQNQRAGRLFALMWPGTQTPALELEMGAVNAANKYNYLARVRLGSATATPIQISPTQLLSVEPNGHTRESFPVLSLIIRKSGTQWIMSIAWNDQIVATSPGLTQAPNVSGALHLGSSTSTGAYMLVDELHLYSTAVGPFSLSP